MCLILSVALFAMILLALTGDSSMNIDDYKSHVIKYDRAVASRLALSIAVIFVAMGLAGAIRIVDEQTGLIAAPFIVFLFGVPLMIFGLWWTDRVYQQFPMLSCKNCMNLLARSKSTVIATGNCPSCGRRVLDDARIGT